MKSEIKQDRLFHIKLCWVESLWSNLQIQMHRFTEQERWQQSIEHYISRKLVVVDVVPRLNPYYTAHNCKENAHIEHHDFVWNWGRNFVQNELNHSSQQ